MKRYFINMHALHNALLIRETLPRHLTRPIHLFADREEEHHKSAAILHANRTARAREIREKRAAGKGEGNAVLSNVAQPVPTDSNT